jgi:hypothetical protein
VVARSAFSVQSGNLKLVHPKHPDDSFEFTYAFCGDCGTPVYAAVEEFAGKVIIQAGSLDDEEDLQMTPVVELNVRRRLGWVSEVKGAEQNQGYAHTVDIE